MTDVRLRDAPDPGREYDRIPVRVLTRDDLDQLVRIDERLVGRSRRDYLAVKLEQALGDTRIVVSLGAEVDGRLAGFLMGRLYYGEFGVPEPVAFLDTIGVHPDVSGQGVARALLGQFTTNLSALGIGLVRTEADWNDWRLLGFLEHSGFRPIPRLALAARIDGR
jgi:ribosomal protein S18 acetylase RimI-like enzyme